MLFLAKGGERGKFTWVPSRSSAQDRLNLGRRPAPEMLGWSTAADANCTVLS